MIIALVVLCVGIWWLTKASSPDNKDEKSRQQNSLKALKQRAEQGDGPALLELAENYCLGKGVRKNKFQCAEWYRKAANLGSGAAMLALGDLYSTGEGFILDKNAAEMWWRKAESTADGAAGAAKRLQESQAAPGRTTDAVQ